MTTKKAYLLSILSGLLFAVCWNGILPSVSLFIAFVPMLFVLHNRNFHYSQIFNFTFISFFLFHLGTVWWLCYSTFWGGLAIFIINSTAMAIVMTFVFKLYRKSNSFILLSAFVSFWLSFEYLHYNWELTWPFMTLGNWLGQSPFAIQWYEYTGVLGGSLWILLSNIILYIAIRKFLLKQTKLAVYFIVIEILIIILPLILSKTIYNTVKFKGKTIEFIVVQPNINPYTEKYDSTLFQQQINRQIELAQSNCSDKELCIVFPESSFPAYINEKNIDTDSLVQLLDNKLINNNITSLIAACYTYKTNGIDTTFYNTTFMLDSKYQAQLYHKSKLVIAVEKLPFADYFGFLKNTNLNFGGYTTSLGIDDNRKVFNSSIEALKIAPVVCYESVYGEFVGECIKQGANCLAVVSNDAWWGNTSGYKQHLMHSQLRAIESRKEIVRAANTGTSCFINTKGEIQSKAKDWTEAVLIGKISPNNYKSFYTKHGDYIGKLALFLAVVLIVFKGIMN